MKILLVSGFLGAGKTTFIKELIRQTGTHPVIMENEYGDNNLDSLELQNAQNDAGKKEDIQVMEFMEGCVCCTMKDSFANSVFTIFSSLDPEYLIIEPTGVGRLSNIIRNLQPLLYNSITLLQPIVVLSPDNFAQNMREWPELYRDQIAHARVVVYSKCEHTPSEVLKQVSDTIREINPDADIIGTHYKNMPKSWWDARMDLDAADATQLDANRILMETLDMSPSVPSSVANASADAASSGAATASTSAGDVLQSAASSDAFMQVSLKTAALHNPGELVMFLEDCLRGAFGHMARAKGTLPVGQEILRFDMADRLYAIAASPDTHCQCVFIGQQLDEKKIRHRLCDGRKSVRKMQRN